MIQLCNWYDLKNQANAAANKRSRLIITPGYDMVICLKKGSVVGMHRHPKPESYHVMQGTLMVRTLDNVLVFLPGEIVKIPAGTWHDPYTQDEYVLYHEVYQGPFDKPTDVEYYPEAA